jgi:hypothetical protein
MRISLRTWCVVVIGFAIPAAVVSSAIAARRPQPLIAAPQISLDVSASSTDAGVLVVSAKAKIPPQPMHMRLWFALDVLDVNQSDPESGAQWRTVWGQEYKHQTIAVRAGTPQLSPTFNERLEMPAGTYLVRVHLREATPMSDRAGNVITPYSPGLINSAYVTVH